MLFQCRILKPSEAFIYQVKGIIGRQKHSLFEEKGQGRIELIDSCPILYKM